MAAKLPVDSPKIRAMAKQEATRRGYTWALRLILLICFTGLLKVTVQEAILKNPQFEAHASGQSDNAGDRIELTARLADLAILVPGFPGAAHIEGQALGAVKESITAFFAVAGAIDEAVRRKLTSYAQAKVPGSREWEVLYQKFFQEELAKRKW